MCSYSELAGSYDIFMDEVPYEQWKTFVLNTFEKYNIPKGLVLDLGCGTGTFTEMLALEGYDMIGVDMSPEMLKEALEKKENSKHDILYLCQDMREFELYGTVAAIVSVCDSINYILKEEELIETFRLVNNYLDPKGIFVFDFNTFEKYKEIGETTIAENREDCSFIWDNYFDEETGINEYDLTLFTREGEMFRRTEETHLQRGYTVKEMTLCLEKAGLKVMEISDADDGGEALDASMRVHIVAMEQGK